jgi:hypothetical protein
MRGLLAGLLLNEGIKYHNTSLEQHMPIIAISITQRIPVSSPQRGMKGRGRDEE